MRKLGTENINKKRKGLNLDEREREREKERSRQGSKRMIYAVEDDGFSGWLLERGCRCGRWIRLWACILAVGSVNEGYA